MAAPKESNQVSVSTIGNSALVAQVKNSVKASVFSVTSSYYMLTQFQPYRYDSKVGDGT